MLINLKLLSCLCVGGIALACSVPLIKADTAKSAKKNELTPSSKKAEIKPQLSALYNNSHILVNGGKHTIIPKGSIIYLPTKDKTKVSETPSGKFSFWPNFLKKNRSWIWTYEVTRDQAKGLKAIPESKLEEFAKINRMVVATYQKSPINILPPPTPPEKKDKE